MFQPYKVNERKRKLSDSDSEDEPAHKKGRRKIKIEYIDDKSRRQITFSKRKAGIMKKAYELTTLTGTEALLLIASETGHVYTFATPKLQPFVTHQTGKGLIQKCLNNVDFDTDHREDERYSEPIKLTKAINVSKPMQPHVIESSLVIVVGKVIPVAPNFNLSDLKDLTTTAQHWGKKTQLNIVCLAGGYPTMSPQITFSSSNELVESEIVIGLKVAEVDYTSPNQPSFSIEKLRTFLSFSSDLVEDMWKDIQSKSYMFKPWKEDPLKPNTLLTIKPSLYVVSTYPSAFVNVVFGVRNQGEGGKGSQVVGISCNTSDCYVCKLNIDEKSHSQRLQSVSGVAGTHMYHLLPELFK